MNRFIHVALEAWYRDSNRKPLVLKGARQVGKTFAVHQFGNGFVKNQEGNYYYFDLKDKNLHLIFQNNAEVGQHRASPQKIIEYIELIKKTKIVPGKDLIFFDEIQDCPQAISTLKYFEQEMKSLHIIAAGSHLGLVKNEESFPVGKVNFLSLFPMTFYEFVWALEEPLCVYLDSFNIHSPQPISNFVHAKCIELLLHYFAVGGLPEAVLRYKENLKNGLAEALRTARTVQTELLTGYEADFSKYSGTVNANHIHSVFRSIPKQLARNLDESTPKFKFSGVIPNQKGFDRIVGPLTWLIKSRLCIQSFIAKKSGHPLLGYTEDNVFKVFYFDVGLLNAALQTPMEAITQNSLDSYKGYLVENFVAQELFAGIDHELITWQEGQAEIEFLMTQGEHIIPIEVKSGMKSRRAKSLDSYIKKYHPKVAYKFSAQNVGQAGGITTLPLYLCGKIFGGGV